MFYSFNRYEEICSDALCATFFVQIQLINSLLTVVKSFCCDRIDIKEIAMNFGSIDVVYNASYNLDRLDNKLSPLDGIYKRKSDGGKGVTVFVLDSGIRSTHVEFEGRASCGFDAVLGIESDTPCEDLRGHGTHVSALIGGKNVGVAKQVNIVSVKISAKDFEIGGAVLYGIQYVLQQKLRNLKKPMVVNMSFGSVRYFPLDYMIETLISVGVTVVTSAGNQGMNACQYSPAGVNGVLAIGASDETDVVPGWSNFGSCVSLHAPGINITSAWKRNDTHYAVASGTSQAAPLVTGAVALYLQMQPTLTPGQIFRLIANIDSLKNALKPGEINNTVVRISKNRLLQTGIFTDTNSKRKNPTCPYTGSKLPLCYSEGWWKKV
jgi:subtilisin family serine protease